MIKNFFVKKEATGAEVVVFALFCYSFIQEFWVYAIFFFILVVILAAISDSKND